MNNSIKEKTPNRNHLIAGLSAICLTSAVNIASADEFDFGISNETARIEYSGLVPERKGLGYSAHLLYHEDDAQVGGASLHVSGRSKASTFLQYTSLGAKVVGYDTDNGPSGGSVALGGFIHHNLAAANLLSIRGDLYYAPSVVSFGDGEQYREIGVRLEYQLVDQASVYLGYRNIEVDFDGRNDVDIDESANIGMIMQF